MGLTDYKRRRGCWVCGLPERAEIDAARREHHMGPDAVLAWLLEEKGYERDRGMRSRINNHFQARHHEQ